MRVTTNDFFIMAIGRAIERFPQFAGYPDKTGRLKIGKDVGVGLAVSAAQGLVVPVIRIASDKTISEIARQSDELVKKARANKLVPDDFDGANIVLSGLGMYGIDSFLAITPPASAGIISIGRFEDEVAIIDDELKTRRIMSIALAADMRIVNEFYAARFLADIVDQLENPETLIS
jgi:pyruvate dehydrogenase E2 component (dihydrolipoamide acetyltransferase)